jgi:pimeloyl-ACP methyl ester carboxylesterase
MTIRLPSLVVALALLCLPAGAAAEDVPVVFLHGFRSDASGWVQTAERLHVRASIDPRVPTVDWTRTFVDQARDLWRRPEFAPLSNGSVVIGHSNGGLVARESTRQRPLGGVVTLGSPHHGVPLLPQFGQWATFSSATTSLVGSVVNAFSRPSNWSWVFTYVVGSLNWARDFNVWSVVYLGGVLGLDRAVPVTADMNPYSPFLQEINSSSNLNREARDLGGRVGIVSIAHDFYFAGPARVVAPDQADGIATALYSTAYGLMFWGNYVLSSADPLDFDATSQGLELINLAAQLLSIDPIYCRLVSSMTFNVCRENDGLLPYTTQEYPGAPNLYIGLDNNGPAHTREREVSEDVIYDALVHFLQVPPRASTPPPPAPAPGPGPDPGPAPGGGEGGGEGVSASLGVDQYLAPGEAIGSPNGFYELVYQHDGNLVLYDGTGGAMWASDTYGSSPGVAVMQGDGNFVIYDSDDVARWSSGTWGYPGAFVVLQDDGNVVVYDTDGTPLWATNTAR